MGAGGWGRSTGDWRLEARITHHASRITHHPSIRGVITVAQEDRVRLVDGQGRGYLFVLGKGVWLGPAALWALARDRRPVTIVYEGEPDLGAVALAIRPEA